MQPGKVNMVVYLTVDTPGEQSNDLLALPNIALIVNQKQPSFCCLLVWEEIDCCDDFAHPSVSIAHSEHHQCFPTI